MLAALLALLVAAPASALAQFPDTVGEPFDARTNGVLAVAADLTRDDLPVASVPAGYTVTWVAYTSDGRPALLWCDRADLGQCSGRFSAGGIVQAKSGTPVRYGLPNPSAGLAGKTVTLVTTIAKQTATGEQTVARERRNLVFASASSTPTVPLPTPTPAEPRWGISTTIRQ